MTYSIRESEVKNILTGKTTKINYEIVNDTGELYGTVDCQEHAEVIAYGLNNGFTEHILGGFSDETVKKIKKEMNSK